MSTQKRKFKSAVAVALLLFLAPGLGSAQESDVVDQLLQDLARADAPQTADRLERRIQSEWSKSGSAAIDLLLKRGRDAMAVDDLEAALDHLTALTDHAPGFAEGWHALALAYYKADAYGPAADALERTLALNPQHFGALRGLGAIFEQVDRPALAYDAYSRVITLRPHDSDVLDALERLEGRVNGTTL